MNCEIPVSGLTLVSDVLSGQRERFQELIQKYQKMVYGVAWSQLGNFHDDEGNDFRRELTLGHPVSYVMLLLGVAIIVQAVVRGFGTQATFLVIAAFCLYGLWNGLRGLRVYDTPRSRAMIACSVLQFVAYLTTGIVEMPLNWLVVVIFSTIIFMNVVMKRFRNSEPSRNDYNLFLRAATGGIVINDATSKQSGERVSSALTLNPGQLVSFARFLGSHCLISDYKQNPDSIRLDLPPARPSALSSIVRMPNAKSSIIIGSNGECDLHFSQADRTAVKQLSANSSSPEQLTAILKLAIESCVADFTSGNSESALHTVEAIDDTEIFKTTQSASDANKRRSTILLVLAIIATLAWALILLF